MQSVCSLDLEAHVGGKEDTDKLVLAEVSQPA